MCEFMSEQDARVDDPKASDVGSMYHGSIKDSRRGIKKGPISED